MREQLRNLEGERRSFWAMFERYGVKNGYVSAEPTILLKNVVDTDTGTCLCDHLWFNLTKGFRDLGVLSEGTTVTFDARVAAYTKGYKGRDWEKAMKNLICVDYRLSYPTKIKIEFTNNRPLEKFSDSL